MKKFSLFWKEFYIGELSINDNNQYKFLVDKEEKRKAVIAGMLGFLVPKEQTEWGSPIAFFEQRLKNMCDVVTKYHTDEFRLLKLE